VIVARKGEHQAISKVYVIEDAPRRGTGPNKLQYGNFDYGYFGSCTSMDFIDTRRLMNEVGLNAGIVNVETPIWHKFIRNNKVIFVPDNTLVNSISWTTLYNAGLVYGIDAPYHEGQPYIPNPAPVNQLKTVTIEGDRYIVRLMRGFSDDVTVEPAANGTEDNSATWPSNEWDDFMYPMSSKQTPVKQRMPKVALMEVFGYTAVQELYSSTTVVRRGASTLPTGYANVSINVGTASYIWRPVLELIEGGN